MPTKPRDNSPERHRVRKESTLDDKERKRRHKTHSSRKTTSKEKSISRTSLDSDDAPRRSSMPGAISEDEENTLRQTESKSSLPYPTFSKQHSKEAVGRAPLNILTPPATDVNASKERLSTTRSPGNAAPPSPPLTEQNVGRRTPKARPVTVETITEEDKTSSSDKDSKIRIRVQPKTSRSSGHLRSSSDLGSKGSPTKTRPTASSPLKVQHADAGVQRSVSQPTRKGPDTGRQTPEDLGNSSSDGTSIAPHQPNIQRPGSRIPVVEPPRSRTAPVNGVAVQNHTSYVYPSPHSSTASVAPPPPPPPQPVSAPRVDYLLQNGGLHHAVPRKLLLAGKPMAVQQAMTANQQPVVVANLFEPYHQLLDDFQDVMSKNGSLAVATGYRSVARRLLDRLEAVFARDISNEFCQCCMCEGNEEGEDVRGVSWGEILELVAGRQELPSWPPFALEASSVGLGISGEIHTPMQKLDIDVPEEYREHYIRQSRKTKQTVDKWLSRNTDTSVNPPEDVDDETLTFSILTHLAVEQRQLFKKILCIVDRPLDPPRRATSPEKGAPPPLTPSTIPRARPQDVVYAGIAIQRLYRLARPPRDPETAIFMLHNPTLHNALATLAAVSNDEWEILTSGRFDGFLRSGANDDVSDIPNGNSRGPTPSNVPNGRINTTQHARGSGNFSTSQSYHSSTPAAATHGAPIAFDEETEIAILADVERDIYAGMEQLEDAFEQLHLKAEAIRRALQERAAGLAVAQQRRRGVNNVEVRIDTPANGQNVGFAGLEGLRNWEAETDDGLGDWDGVSELAPDDSASNISSSRRRRPKRRTERARGTPMIQEEDFDGESEGGSPVKG